MAGDQKGGLIVIGHQGSVRMLAGFASDFNAVIQVGDITGLDQIKAVGIPVIIENA
jgi:hypothetical protein